MSLGTPEFKAAFGKAMELKRRGSTQEANRMLSQLVDQRPNIAKLRCALGDTYWDLGEHENAKREFAKATEIAPGLELSSKGLFHVLWELGRRSEAIAEMNRFLSVSDSRDYRDIQSELREKGLL